MACNNDTSKKLPKMIELLEELAPTAYKFKIFGTLLNIKTYVLEEIDQSSRDCKEKLYKVLEHRLNLMPPLTWQDVVRALRSPVLDKQSLAYQIESKYISPSLSETSETSASIAASTSSAQGVSNRHQQQRNTSAHYLNNGNTCSSIPTSFGSFQSQPSGIRASPGPAPPQHGIQQSNPRIPPPQMQTFPNPWQFYGHPQPFQPPMYPGYPPMAYGNMMPSPYGIPQQSPMYNPQPPPSVGVRVPTAQQNSQLLDFNIFELGKADANTSLPHQPQHSSSSDAPPAKRPHTELEPTHTPSQEESKQKALYEEFKKHVKTVYRSRVIEKRPEVLKLPTPGKVFINLAFIDRKTEGLWKRDGGSRTEYDEITEAMVRDGNVDVIEGRKCPIDMNNIAANLPETALEKVILVEGAPGVGKSTFAWEFCRRWERGEIAQQYDLVLLLRLRDEHVTKAENLEDLIYQKKFKEAVVSELESNLGINLLLILEGYDELPEVCRRSPSLFLELINGQLLPFATLMITSRPWATCDVLEWYSHRLFQHIEVLGFTKGQIISYIHSVLPEKEAVDLKENLQRHPQIKMCMYIPLNCAIVVTVYQESKATGIAMPTTLTGLYTALAHTLLLHHLRAKDITSGHIENFEQLPKTVYTKFCALCELAYSSIAGEGDQIKLIFTHLPRDFDSLGFMDSVFELFVTRKAVVSHNFLHLTFQEFLAAVYISKMDRNSRLEHFKRQSEGRLRVVLRFLAGLTNMEDFQTPSDLYLFLNEPTTQGRTQINHSISIQVSWLLEAQRGDLLKEAFAEDKIVEYVCEDHFDFPAVGYCIVHSRCKWILTIDRAMEEDDVKMLVDEMQVGKNTCGVIFGLRGKVYKNGSNFRGLLISLEGLNVLFSAANVHLGELWLTLPAQAPCSAISWPDLSDLHVLGLHILEWKSYKLGVLLNCPTLETLVFNAYDDGATLASEDCEALANFIKCSTSLKELSFPCETHDMEVEDLETIMKVLTSNTSLQLERMDLRGVYDSILTNWSPIAEYLTTANKLLEFRMPVCDRVSSSHALQLARALGDKTHLLTQNKKCVACVVNGDCDVPPFVELLVNFPEILECQEEIDMNIIQHITNEGIIKFAKLFQQETTVVAVNLSCHNIGEDGARALAEALSTNTNLKRLDLSSSKLGDKEAEAMANMLCSNKTLESLNLSRNVISDYGARSIANALRHNTTLSELGLFGNEISSDGKKALSAATTSTDCRCKVIIEHGTQAIYQFQHE